MITDKAKIGAIGECMVMSKLLQHNWDAINANLSINNCKSIDLICINEKKQTKLIQVKTTIQNSIPTGFSLDKAYKTNLEEQIVGPWVFVFANIKKEDMTFRYFILSRSQVIKFISETNQWYLNWERANPIKQDNPCCLDIKWFTNDDFNDGKHKVLSQILQENPENNWNNIWKD